MLSQIAKPAQTSATTATMALITTDDVTYASRRLPRELTVTRDGPARPNPDIDYSVVLSVSTVKVLSRVLGPLIEHITNVEESVVLQDEGIWA